MASITKLFRSKLRPTFCASRPVSTTTERNVIKSRFKDISIPEEPLWNFIFQKTHKWPNKIALECAVTGKKLTYDQLRKQSDNFNRFLRKKLKLKNGDVVAIMLPNTPEFPVAFLGTLQAGLMPTTVNPMYTEDEIFRQLKQTSVSAVVALDEFVPILKKVCDKIVKDIAIFSVKSRSGSSLQEKTIDFTQIASTLCDIEDTPLIHQNRTGCLMYSSGTTGMPKAVEHTMRGLVAHCCQPMSENFKFIEDSSSSHQDIIPSVLPFYHVYGIASLLWMLHSGSKILTVPKFSPELYASTIRKHKPHVLLTVPPLVTFLTNSELVNAKDLEAVRIIISGAAPLGALDEESFLKKCTESSPKFLQAYGLTETAVVMCSPNNKEKVPASAGELLPNTFAKVVSLDETNPTNLGPNESGELYLKGPQLCKGYLNNYEANKEAFVDGWFKTGDIAHYDQDGSIFITDRIKDLIKVNAYPVAPAELEELLRNYDDIQDAAVIGIPDKTYGQVPKAFVVAKPGRSLNIPEVLKFIEERTAPYKKIRGGITITNSIPKLASGKILKKTLKEEYLKK